jgi:hypothetical protein
MCGADSGQKSVCCTFHRRNFEKGRKTRETACVNMVNSTVNKRTYHIESSFSNGVMGYGMGMNPTGRGDGSTVEFFGGSADSICVSAGGLGPEGSVGSLGKLAPVSQYMFFIDEILLTRFVKNC